ncbi:hypothetical protein C0991_012261 [Blastosporella zonata]|nr:hypothetical protein C0991_012261 [Blastosporella zonata]
MLKSLPEPVTNLYRLFTDALEPPQLPHHNPGAGAPGLAGTHLMSGAPGDGETGSGEWDMLKDRGELGGGGLDGVLKLLGEGRVPWGHGGDEEAEVPFGLQDKESAREAIKFAAEALQLWEEWLMHLVNMEWSGAAYILAATQELWNEWCGANWSMMAPFGHFFEEPPSRGDNVNMEDKGGMDLASMAVKAEQDARAAWALFWEERTKRAKRAKRRAGKCKAFVLQVNNLEPPLPKVAKQAGGQGSMRFLVDEGLEGTIGVHLNWTTWAVVKLAPYAERLAYRAAQGPCQTCERMGAGPTCWYLTTQHPCCRCTNRGAVCKDWDGELAQKPAPTKGCFCLKLPSPAAPAPEEVEGAPGSRWTGLAGRLMQAQAEVAKMGYLHQLAQLELQELVEELDAGEADAKGKEETREHWEAEMARREGEKEERGTEVTAEGAESEGDVGREAPKEGEEGAKMAKKEDKEERDREAKRDAGASEAFPYLPRGVRPGLGEMSLRKRRRMAAKKAALRRMRQG